jgi:hypothetical protein
MAFPDGGAPEAQYVAGDSSPGSWRTAAFIVPIPRGVNCTFSFLMS